MKALWFDRTGTLDALTIAELPVPEPGKDEVRVRVHAAGIHPSGLKNVLGRFPRTTYLATKTGGTDRFVFVAEND
ncbi:MAG TPA: hypothetical protein VJT49_13305 [Amycolatopsis sp.]|uniref:hypothetical protein n=1 Tax=Amycolatopsis sp. TaxID=37632 RepID=UPI002B489F7D|nr:hypothetical protein [Amycolatopsis sp.]HJQ45741.1 hypothetical protein [Amycolatopsis sp.]HKS46063.1 hypothetical protein [Amycolatopsis sp.]